MSRSTIAPVEAYRAVGIFAHRNPVRQVVERIATLELDGVHAMHGCSLAGSALAPCRTVLREREFAYDGRLLGRELPINDVAAGLARPPRSQGTRLCNSADRAEPIRASLLGGFATGAQRPPRGAVRSACALPA